VTFALVLVLTFVLMEPVAYLEHRLIMHGVGWYLHAAHHRPRETTFDANDVFPIFFAAIAIVLFWLGTSSHPLLLPVAIGLTAYGVCYSFVHDLYIHQRLGALPKMRYLEYLKRAHALHHLYNEEPYGMLLPIIPARLRPMMELEVVLNWNPA
jgi:beta-carotene 3-hydroxylase